MTSLAFRFRKRLALIASHYPAVIDEDDGGFGLTAGQGTSLVNTAEALEVLRAAHNANISVDTGVVSRALGYLASNSRIHCAPKSPEGGRGPKTRFVTFSLSGIAAWPEALSEEALSTVSWGLEWLQTVCTDLGLPEEMGLQDVSLFQNAQAITAICRVLALPTLSDEDRDACHYVISRCIRGSLFFALPNCTWPRQVFRERTSPAKTARVVVALQKARELDLFPDHVQFAEQSRKSELDFQQLTRGAGLWLTDNVDKWRGRFEADPDVTGTQWQHLSYALCLQAIAGVGTPLTDSVAAEWKSLWSLWDREARSWSEPTDPPLATIRADHAAVQAFETLLDRQGTRGVDELQLAFDRLGTPEQSTLGDLIVASNGQFRYQPPRNKESIQLGLTNSQRRLLAVVLELGGEREYVSAKELAHQLGNKKESSVGQFVRRLNSAFQDSTFAEHPIVISDKGRGYRLNTRHVRYSNS